MTRLAERRARSVESAPGKETLQSGLFGEKIAAPELFVHSRLSWVRPGGGTHGNRNTCVAAQTFWKQQVRQQRNSSNGAISQNTSPFLPLRTPHLGSFSSEMITCFAASTS